MKGWPLVIGLGLTKIPLKLVAPLVVPFLSTKQRVLHPWFGARDASDTSWWNIAVRNGVHNLYTRPMPEYTTAANTDDHSLENEDGFQWRRRESADGRYVSFRMTWGKVRSKGKREVYIGWVMNEVADYMRLSFLQVRLF